MQFVTNGPDVPDTLLQAHEEGRVVFFCGAGISAPAGLPDFKGLVDITYNLLGTKVTVIEGKSYKDKQYDATLDQLERRYPGKRFSVRQKICEALKPNLRRKGATNTHEALLRLSRNRDGNLRLVTTNFDRLFEFAAKRTKDVFDSYSAPILPIPKKSRWNGLVYLHGRLPASPNESSLNRLVITSGDFGLAYLIDRWAARFVSELFRNFEVCFVGYGINDPVLRYMMDALAADEMLGESSQNAWAFGSCEPGREDEKTIEWISKGVKPVLYYVENGSNDHSMLHRSLQRWSELYRDGVNGKESIVVELSNARPSESTKQDDFVGRMLWALSDKLGLPAKRFADINPVPPLEWLFDAFETRRFEKVDLPRFGIIPTDEFDEKFRFSLIHRPAPSYYAQGMSPLNGGRVDSGWDSVMSNLVRWLVRHLNDPRLIVWIAKRGGRLHESLIWRIEDTLDYIHRLECEGNETELEKIRTDSPKLIPSRMMRIIWGMILNGRLKRPERDLGLYTWKRRLDRDGLTTSLRQELRELLSPKVEIRSLARWGRRASDNQNYSKLNEIVDWELVLHAEDARSVLLDIADKKWIAGLPSLLDEFQQLLLDALELLQEVGEADSKHDQSFFGLPSISPHSQNRGTCEWVTLIELVRDSWLAVHSKDSDRAKRIAFDWFEIPFATFKRLALFAASQENRISSGQWVRWLSEDNSCWLWSEETHREALRLIVLQGPNLEEQAQTLLESAILIGPPREKYPDDLNSQRWLDLRSRSIWLRLAKLQSSGIKLGLAAKERLDELSKEYPQWELAHDQRDEFPIWMSGTGYPDFEETRVNDIIPCKRKEIVAELEKRETTANSAGEDNWREVCKKHLLNALFALKDLGAKGIWPTSRWKVALNVWSETERRAWWSWRYVGPVSNDLPESVFQVLIHDFSRWLEVVSKLLDGQEYLFFKLCKRVLDLPISAETGMTRNGIPLNQPVTEAINHPVGDVTQALMNVWFSRIPNDNDRLPQDIEPLFTSLCDIRIDRFCHGRVLLASRLIALFRVDPEWTERNLLPLFDWIAYPSEAKGVWEGFLWSPRPYPPLMVAIKSQFLECTRHYDELGQHREQFAGFLTFAALQPTDGFTYEEFRVAFDSLPKEGLEACARVLVQALDSAADQREENWKNRVQPFWHYVWPKSHELVTPQIVESLCSASPETGISCRLG